MKVLGMIGLSLALGTAPLARADVPVNPTALGSVDAVITFCGQLNPSGASAYQSLRDSLIGKPSEDAREAAVKTPAYQQAFNEISGVLKSAPKDWAVKACTDIVPSTKADHGNRPIRPGDDQEDHGDRKRGDDRGR